MPERQSPPLPPVANGADTFPQTGLSALGLMIPVLNRWLSDSAEPAVDCADALVEQLLHHGYDITCKACGASWTAFCSCRRPTPPAPTEAPDA